MASGPPRVVVSYPRGGRAPILGLPGAPGTLPLRRRRAPRLGACSRPSFPEVLLENAGGDAVAGCQRQGDPQTISLRRLESRFFYSSLPGAAPHLRPLRL